MGAGVNPRHYLVCLPVGLWPVCVRACMRCASVGICECSHTQAEHTTHCQVCLVLTTGICVVVNNNPAAG